MEKKRKTFLFGAGAALEWGAPKTWELTDLILNSGFKTCDGTTTITRFIYQKLLDQGYTETNINFETVISIIEDFVVFYADHDTHKIPSFQRCFFDDQWPSDILNFSVAGDRSHGSELEIPKGVKYLFAKSSLNNETPEQFFFEHLIGDLLNDVCARIIEYSYHSETHSVINNQSKCNKSFVDWMKLHEQQTPLRLYSLNYDNVFKVLLKDAGLEIFEGFDTDHLDKSGNGIST